MSYTQLKKSFRYEGRYTISKYIGRSSRKLPTQKLGPYTTARKFSKKDAAGYSICYIDKRSHSKLYFKKHMKVFNTSLVIPMTISYRSRWW